MTRVDRETKPQASGGREAGALLGDMAYESVRQAIRAGDMKPGERISEYKVAQWLNVSRTPAREALRRLENEGLLASHPRRGLIVASVDADALFELYAAREVLEGATAAAAAQRATDAEIAALRHMVESEALILDDPVRMQEHNRLFHAHVYRAAHNRYLLKILLEMADVLSAHRSISTLTKQERRNAVLAEHHELVEAIATRDAGTARAAAVKHVQAALRARTLVHHESLTAPR